MAILELQQTYNVDDFEDSWNHLLSKSFDKTPFLTYEWISTWSKHFGQTQKTKLFTVEKNGSVSVAAPVSYSTRELFGSKYREVRFIAAPESDYQVFIVTNLQDAYRAVNSLIENIIEDSGADRLIFSDVPEDSFTANVLAGIKQKWFGETKSTINTCPYVALPESQEIFLQNIGANMRRNLKVWGKRASSDYKVGFVHYQEFGSLKDSMKILFDLHQKSQTAKGNYGVFATDAFKQFHLDLANAFAKRGWLALFFLTFNDEPVSTIYSFEYNRKLYAYLTGFDPLYSEYRPGHLAFRSIMQYGINKGLRELDFLRGDEEYKSRWNPAVRRNFEFNLVKRGIKSQIYNWNTGKRSYAYLNQRIHSISQRLEGLPKTAIR